MSSFLMAGESHNEKKTSPEVSSGINKSDELFENGGLSILMRVSWG